MYLVNTFVKKLPIFLSLFFIAFLISCKKDKRQEDVITFRKGSTGVTWESDKVTAIMVNDSLVLRGNKNDGSSIAIILTNSYEGIYTIDFEGLQSLVIINEDGDKDTKTNYISVEGSVTIDKHDSKNKRVEGHYNILASKIASITNKENITGTFTAKYTKY